MSFNVHGHTRVYIKGRRSSFTPNLLSQAIHLQHLSQTEEQGKKVTARKFCEWIQEKVYSFHSFQVYSEFWERIRMRKLSIVLLSMYNCLKTFFVGGFRFYSQDIPQTTHTWQKNGHYISSFLDSTVFILWP